MGVRGGVEVSSTPGCKGSVGCRTLSCRLQTGENGFRPEDYPLEKGFRSGIHSFLEHCRLVPDSEREGVGRSRGNAHSLTTGRVRLPIRTGTL